MINKKFLFLSLFLLFISGCGSSGTVSFSDSIPVNVTSEIVKVYTGDVVNNTIYNDTLWTGWYDYTDSQYNESNPFVMSGGVEYTMPNDAQGFLTRGQLPEDNDYPNGFYNGTHILGKWNDSLLITVDFKAKSTSGTDSYIEVWFDIGGGIAPLYKRINTFPKGNNVERPITLTTNVYTLNTWEQNGALVKVFSDDNAEIYDIRFVISRMHKARN